MRFSLLMMVGLAASPALSAEDCALIAQRMAKARGEKLGQQAGKELWSQFGSSCQGYQDFAQSVDALKKLPRISESSLSRCSYEGYGRALTDALEAKSRECGNGASGTVQTIQ